MSWHYSQALEAAFSADSSAGSAPCAPSSGTPTHGTFWSPDKTTDASKPSQSGMTFRPSTVAHGKALLTWYLAAFRARTSARPARVPGSMGNAPECGGTWRESSLRFSLDSSLWRTHRCLWEEEVPESQVTLPRWGMLDAHGVLWERTTPEHLTSGIESGSWPTVRSTDGERGGRGDLIQAIRGNPNSHYKSWPTPHGMSKDGKTNGPSGNELGRAVNQAERFATPTSSMVTMADMEQAKTAGNSPNRPSYAEAKAMWATPTASVGGPEPKGKTGRKLVTQVGGSLNPTWVEWLMGWPLGWTDCDASATAKFRQWSRSHGRLCADDESADEPSESKAWNR